MEYLYIAIYTGVDGVFVIANQLGAREEALMKLDEKIELHIDKLRNDGGLYHGYVDVLEYDFRTGETIKIRGHITLP